MAKKEDINFNKNEDVNKLLVTDLNKKLDVIYLGYIDVLSINS